MENKHIPKLKEFKEQEKVSINSTCELLEYSRRVYYRSKNTFKIKRDVASKVIELVNNIRILTCPPQT